MHLSRLVVLASASLGLATGNPHTSHHHKPILERQPPPPPPKAPIPQPAHASISLPPKQKPAGPPNSPKSQPQPATLPTPPTQKPAGSPQNPSNVPPAGPEQDYTPGGGFPRIRPAPGQILKTWIIKDGNTGLTRDISLSGVDTSGLPWGTTVAPNLFGPLLSYAAGPLTSYLPVDGDSLSLPGIPQPGVPPSAQGVPASSNALPLLPGQPGVPQPGPKGSR